MSDIFSKEKRSEIMSKVKSCGNVATEICLINIFKKNGIKGWRRKAKVFGKPDFVFYKERLAIFIDGCFWHGCPKHRSIPENNRSFWEQKLLRNKNRDKLVNKTLRNMNWHVMRIWQHELKVSDNIARRIINRLNNS